MGAVSTAGRGRDEPASVQQPKFRSVVFGLRAISRVDEPPEALLTVTVGLDAIAGFS